MISTLLVGFGFSAKTFHLPFLRCLDDYQISGVVSSRPDEVKAVLADVPVWSSLEEALAAVDFNLVVITTPSHLHAVQARDALNANCNVLIEKPFTLSTDDAIALVKLADDKGRALSVYHNRRFDGDFLTLKSLIDNGKLGKVRRLESRFDRFRPVPRDRWRENAGAGSGITWDLAPHLIDQALVLFGMPDAVSADIRILREDGQSDDMFDITLTYSSLQVKLGSSPFQAGPTLRFDAQGSKGCFRKFFLDPQEGALREGKIPGGREWGVTPTNENGVFYNETSKENIETKKGNYSGFYQQLAATIVSGDVSPCTAKEALMVIHIIELARISAQTNAQVLVK